MSSDSDIVCFVKDPSLLIELCREVIDQLKINAGDPETGTMQVQLREIAKAIERLENIGVSVPDSLRSEKTSLIAALSIKMDANQALANLIDGLEIILNDIKDRPGRPSKTTPPKRIERRRTSSEKKQTPRSELISYLLDSLNELGGSAHCNDVLSLMEKKLKDKFLPGDLEKDNSFGQKWKHNAHWARLNLANDGILIKDSPRGYWQLRKGTI